MREKFITVTCLTHKFDRGNIYLLTVTWIIRCYGSYDKSYMSTNIGLDDMAYLIQSIIHENHME